MLVYLDICVIQRPFDDPQQLRVRLETEATLLIVELAERGTITLVRSAAHEIENAQNPFADRKAHAEHVLSLAVRRVATSERVGVRAEAFVRAGIDTLDALHLASAAEAGADWFCTTDDRLLRRSRRADTNAMRVVSPIDLVSAFDTL